MSVYDIFGRRNIFIPDKIGHCIVCLYELKNNVKAPRRSCFDVYLYFRSIVSVDHPMRLTAHVTNGQESRSQSLNVHRVIR